MSLSSSRTSKITQTIVLFKMGAVPTTEDLKYALAEAIRARKAVELPFKHPENGIVFTVRVTAGTNSVTPPKWTFLLGEEHGNTMVLWTKETNEVLVIQGKIRVDSLHGIPQRLEAQLLLSISDLAKLL
jgi:hypothetical protein